MKQCICWLIYIDNILLIQNKKYFDWICGGQSRTKCIFGLFVNTSSSVCNKNKASQAFSLSFIWNILFLGDNIRQRLSFYGVGFLNLIFVLFQAQNYVYVFIYLSWNIICKVYYKANKSCKSFSKQQIHM